MMARSGGRLLRSIVRLAVGAALLATVAGGTWLSLRAKARAAGERIGKLPKTVVHRADLHVTLTAGGRVESPQKTLIECELENLQVRSEGRVLNAGGFSTILDLVPDGSVVKRDEVLCRLDSSDYEELVRQQEIIVQEARAERAKAELDVKAAELALVEFHQGTWSQACQDYEGQITLGEADLKRQTDRLAWAQRMSKSGYISLAQLQNEEQALQRIKINLAQVRGAYANLRRFGGLMSQRALENRLYAAKTALDYQKMRVERHESRLEKFRDQVEACTVRAPHDGLVIYANEPDGDPRVEAGARVYQKMDLFYLPELESMEVEATLNETVVDRVQPGMRVRIKVEALPGYALEGQVTLVSPLPAISRGARLSGKEVVNYIGRIKLDSIPRGLLPGMTAEVEILTGQRPRALVVPAEAVAVEGGREVCYVAHDENLERREVKVGQAGRELLEVTEGLEEGEKVVLDPRRVDDLPGLVGEATGEGDGAERTSPAEH
jgi:HlyD family secretion protein